MCCSPWGRKESDTTERLNLTVPLWPSCCGFFVLGSWILFLVGSSDWTITTKCFFFFFCRWLFSSELWFLCFHKKRWAPVLLLHYLVSFRLLTLASFSVSFADPVHCPYCLSFNVPWVLSPHIFHFVPSCSTPTPTFYLFLGCVNLILTIFNCFPMLTPKSVPLAWNFLLCARLLDNDSLLDLGGGNSGMPLV